MPEQPGQGISQFAAPSAADLLHSLSVDPEQGLSTEEVLQRQLRYGPNLPSSHRPVSDWKELLRHFKSPLLIILLLAATLSFTMGETVSGGIIMGTVLLSVLIDFFLERDARQAADSLRKTVLARATVLRDGKPSEVEPDGLVPGDILLLNSGHVVPADARLLVSSDLFANQSALTGESFPVAKITTPVDADGSDITAMDNILFMGSGVQSGSGKALVVRTGASTEFGKVAEQLGKREEESDFANGLRRFGILVMKITLILVVFIFLVNALLKHNILESFLFSLAVAVGLTPELLPMVMSVTMSRGSLRMAKKGAVVKKVMAIPNFGSMDVLCTDKTGTLTQDRIAMVGCVDREGKESPELFSLAWMNAHFQVGSQNPLDEAILQYGTPIVDGYEKTGELPFDFTRRRMSVMVKRDGQGLLICKGAPEELIKVSAMDEQQRSKAEELYASMSRAGYRLLAIGTRELPTGELPTLSSEEGLQLQGFLSFLDPPKEDAREVIAELRSIGVEVKVITGDNSLVTEKLCSSIGLEVKGILLGSETEGLPDADLSVRAASTTIFARFSPEQKNRVIRALRAVHHAVGYLGDGINDGPSLRSADVGISVSSATDVARDAADIILTRKDLMVLKDGILEGRKTFANTMKYIHMDLSSNFGNMFSVAAATTFLPFLPMLPVQILLNNFLYDLSQVAIPTDNVDEGYVRKPRRWDMRQIRNYMILFGLISSVFDMATFYLLYKAFPVTTAQFRTGWFMESLATQILVVYIIRTSEVPFCKSRPGKWLVVSTLSCLTLGWSLPYLPFASAMGFEALPLKIVGMIVGLVMVYLIAAESMKKFIFRRYMPEAWE